VSPVKAEVPSTAGAVVQVATVGVGLAVGE
jgi:hypothetical protein